MDIVMDITAMVTMDTMARERLRLKLLLSQDTAIMAMAMVIDIVMDITAMVTMDTMAKERLRLSLDTTIMAIVMVMGMDMGMDMDMAIVMDTMDNFNTKYLCCAESSV